MALRDNNDEMLKKRVDEFPVICHQSKQHTRTHSSNNAPTISSISTHKFSRVMLTNCVVSKNDERARAMWKHLDNLNTQQNIRVDGWEFFTSQQKFAFVLRTPASAHFHTPHVVRLAFAFYFHVFFPLHSFPMPTRSHNTANDHCRVTQTFAFYRDSSVCSSFTLGSDWCVVRCSLCFAPDISTVGTKIKMRRRNGIGDEEKRKKAKCSNSLCCPFHLSRAKKLLETGFHPKNNIQYRLIELNETWL